MSTQITTTRHGGALAPAGHLTIEGLEGLTSNDVILPRWSLIQPTSRKDGADEHVGQFVRNLDGVFREHLDAVVLMIQPSRLLWSADTSDRRPECYSRDGATGSVYGDCATCQFNTQANPSLVAEMRNGGQPRICSFGYNLIIVDDLEEKSPALLGAMGTSVRPAKTLISQFATKRQSPFASLVRVESEKQVNEKGKFYVLKFSVQRRFDDAQVAEWRDLYLNLKGATIQEVEDAPGDAPVDADEPRF